MVLRPLLFCLLSTAAITTANAATESPVSDQDRLLAREILNEIIPVRSVEGKGQTKALAELLAARLRAGGFAAEDIDIPTAQKNGEKVAGLVARYAGKPGGDKKPIVLIAHMDVVDAGADAWSTPPFTPTEKDGYLYARGSTDNKSGVALLVATFIRLKQEGFMPDRDIIVAISGDEESGMITTRMLTKHRWIAGADFALNADAGVGSAGTNGGAPSFSIQSAEKTYATFYITAKNRGGHSSAPRPDNAIFDLADAVKKLQTYKFPVAFNDITRIMAEDLAAAEGGEAASALRTLMSKPTDAKARAYLEANPIGTDFLYTTCVPTMLEGGVAENALPQRVTVTVNCRIMPGVPVANVETTLKNLVGGDRVEVTLKEGAVESPVSPVREDLFASITNSIHAVYPGANVIASMSSGGTDGREYRRAGIPTYGAGALVLKRPDDFRAHGIDERLPLATYDQQLIFWDTLLKDIAGAE